MVAASATGGDVESSGGVGNGEECSVCAWRSYDVVCVWYDFACLLCTEV